MYFCTLRSILGLYGRKSEYDENVCWVDMILEIKNIIYELFFIYVGDTQYTMTMSVE